MSAAPKYQQLADDLKLKITLGELAPDVQLPTEWQLVADYGLSRGTVRQALQVLEQAGFIRRQQGRGMFVNAPRPALPSFTLEETGQTVSMLRTPCAEQIAADAAIAERLQIAVGTPVFHVIQVRYIDAAPAMYEERWLATRWYPDLLEADISQTPMHWILVHQARLPLVRLTHDIEIRLPDADEAARLRLGVATPVFAIDRLSYTRANGDIVPAVFYRGLCHGDDYALRAQFMTGM